MTFTRKRIQELEKEIAEYQARIRYFEERAAEIRYHVDHVIKPQIDELKMRDEGRPMRI